MKELLTSLSWNNDKETQIRAIDSLSMREDYDFKNLILPINKTCWENAAIVISRKNDQILIENIEEILVWFQDMNWPGAKILRDRLSKLDKSLMKPKIQKVIDKAKKEGDEIWCEWLEAFKTSNERMSI